MAKRGYLIDTNVVIDYLAAKLPPSGQDFIGELIDTAANISVVTKIEVLGFNASPEHYKLLADFINDLHVLNLTDAVIDQCIEVRKKHKTKLPDAIIAATALVHGFTIVSKCHRL
jgi:predicted nucleic acid-binding protein